MAETHSRLPVIRGGQVWTRLFGNGWRLKRNSILLWFLLALQSSVFSVPEVLEEPKPASR